MASGRVLAVRTFQAAFWIVWLVRIGFLVRDGLDSIFRPAWLVVLWLIVTGVAAFRPDLLRIRPSPDVHSDISGEGDPHTVP